ncbi:MAG: hypothetical protein K1X35_05925 [Caulobacteraceae bacterium]|nr:hypothetical protein [Caulobacteraceae bacterium]
MYAKRLILSAAAVFLWSGAIAPSAAHPTSDPTVHYSAAPVVSDGVLTSLAIEIRFRGDADGETRLDLPSQWAGETEYWRHVSDLSVEGAAAREDGPEGRVLTHAPGAEITVRYRVLTAYDSDPQVGKTRGNPYRPIVRPSWFSAIGHGVFATPGADPSRPADFRWGGIPAGWRVASDLDHSAQGARLFVGDIQESVMLGGPGLKTYTRKVKGAEVRLGVLGDWSKFRNDDLADMIARILTAQRDYWRAPGESYFVALTPMLPQDGSISLGGTGLGDAFSLYGGTDTELAFMRQLLAHEHMHTWSPRALGGMSSDPANEAAGYWFSEGFTDFLTHRTLLRSGVWSLQEFVDGVNESMLAYAVSPYRTAPNSTVVEKFWSDGRVQKLPYQRGMLLALYWDYRLRQATGGRHDLDDVLLTQVDRARQMRDKGESPIAPDLFARIYRDLGGPDLAGDYERYATRGEAVLLPESQFGDCARIETVRRARFERGWDPEATTANNNVVTGLRDDSPAYRAGLRNGMQIVKREFGEVGNSTVEYGLRVRAPDGTETVYRFMPAGSGTETIQRIVLAPNMSKAKQAACARSMSGA